MRGKPLIVILCLVLCVVVGAVAFFVYSATKAQAHNGQPCQQTGRNQQPVGITLSLTSAPADRACFTVDDVKAYIKTHAIPMAGTVSSKPAKILSIEFITSKEARERMKGDSVGVADDAPVCYVVLYGPFQTGSVPPGAKPLVSDKGVEIFDGRTGRLLVFWMPDTN